MRNPESSRRSKIDAEDGDDQANNQDSPDIDAANNHSHETSKNMPANWWRMVKTKLGQIAVVANEYRHKLSDDQKITTGADKQESKPSTESEEDNEEIFPKQTLPKINRHGNIVLPNGEEQWPREHFEKLHFNFVDRQDFLSLISDKPKIRTLGYQNLYDLAYYNSDAAEVVNKMDKAELKSFCQDKEMLAKLDLPFINQTQLTAYLAKAYKNEDLRNLLAEIPNGNGISDNEKRSLTAIIASKNKYHVKDLDELRNYDQFVADKLAKQLQSNDVHRSTDALKAIMCPDISPDQLTPSDFDPTALYKSGIINHKEFEIINFYQYLDDDNIYTRGRALDELKELELKPEEIVGIGTRIVEKSYRGLINKWNNELFDLDSIGDGIEHGNIINPNTGHKINLVKLDGAKFKILHSTISAELSTTQRGNTKNLTADPSRWTKLLGTTLISTSLISDNYLNPVGEISEEGHVRFGFNQLSNICGMKAEDAYSPIISGHLGRTGSGMYQPMTTPDEIIRQSPPDQYNEITIPRIDQAAPHQANGRILPDCIISFSHDTKDINAESIKFADYFHIPVLLINPDKYHQSLKTPEEREKEFMEDLAPMDLDFDSLSINLKPIKHDEDDDLEISLNMDDGDLLPIEDKEEDDKSDK